MKKLLFKYKFQKYIKVIILLLILLVVVISSDYINNYIESIKNENPTKLSVFGTLIGTLIGGILSLLGSYWVNTAMEKRKAQIKRKDTIYGPLYDELININNNVLARNPFPRFILLGDYPKGAVIIPQYSTWISIKNDTRYLETPQILISEMEKLFSAVNEYNKYRKEATKAIDEVLNNVIMANDGIRGKLRNAGELIDTRVLQGSMIDLCSGNGYIKSDHELLAHEKELINQSFYDQCNKHGTIIKARESYSKVLKVQEGILELLTILIKTIVNKYKR